MDKIYLNNLQIDTLIGVFDWEREIRQTLQFDFEFEWDIRQAAASDDLADTLDYGAVSARVVALVEASSYQLIESLAEAICTTLLTEFAMPAVTLTLTKPVKLHGQNTAIIKITRRQNG